MIEQNFTSIVKVMMGVDEDVNCAYIEILLFRRKVRVYNTIPTKLLYQDLVKLFTGRAE